MAKILDDDIRVCDDCAVAIANDDYSGMNDETQAAVRAGMAILNKRGWLVVGEEQGFSWMRCQCCGGLAGNRHSCALIGDSV